MGELGWWRFNKDGEFAVKAKERTHRHFPNLLDCRWRLWIEREGGEGTGRSNRWRRTRLSFSLSHDATVYLIAWLAANAERDQACANYHQERGWFGNIAENGLAASGAAGESRAMDIEI